MLFPARRGRLHKHTTQAVTSDPALRKAPYLASRTAAFCLGIPNTFEEEALHFLFYTGPDELSIDPAAKTLADTQLFLRGRK